MYLQGIYGCSKEEVALGWVGGIIEDSILKYHQNDMPFDNWLQSLQVTTALIIGMYAELDDAALHTHIKSNMNTTLKGDAFCAKTHTEPDFDKWLASLKVLDHVCLEQEYKLKEMIEKDHTARLKLYCDCTLTTPSQNVNHNYSNTSNTTT